jgi:uncharacterized delta-60 repeat protein
MSPRRKSPASSRPARRSRRPARSTAGVVAQPVERRLLMAGQLDTSWNTYGQLSIAPPAGSVAQTSIIAVQPDERVVVAGVYHSSSGSFTQVSRLTPQGKPDPTFAGGGTVTLNFTASSLYVETNGKILVSGPDLEQLDANGTVDTTFGSGTGIVVTPFPLAGVVVEPGGDILASGNDTAGKPEIVCYNADGSINTSFGNNGATTIAIAGAGAATYKIGAVTLNSAGQPIIGFAANGDAGVVTFGVVRLTTAGLFDTTFGIGGVAELAGYSQPALSGGLTVAPSGVIYQVGTYNYGSTTGVGYLMAYAANGQYADISPTGGLDTFASAVTIGSDGKPIVIGTAVQGSGASTQTVIAVDRFDAVNPAAPVWTPDVTFGGTGLVTVAYNGPSIQDNASVGDLGFAAYELPNGNVVLGGASLNPGSNTISTFNVTRLIGDGSIAASVATITGTVFFDNNFNGVLDGSDYGLPSLPVSLETSTGTFIEEVYTSSAGLYTFNGLAPGTYQVVEALPAGFTHTTPDANATDSRTITVVADQTVINENFGVTGTDSISGEVFDDLNSNGALDNGETGVANVTVYLDLNGDGAFTSADTGYVTNSTGDFTFTHLTPGTYLVRIVTPNGDLITTPMTLPLDVTLTGSTSSTGSLFGLHL